MLNWVSMKLPHFKPNRLASLDVEKPKPGSEGTTTSKESAGSSPKEAGSVKGPISFL